MLTEVYEWWLLPEAFKTVGTRPQRQNHAHGWWIQKHWKLKTVVEQKNRKYEFRLEQRKSYFTTKTPGFCCRSVKAQENVLCNIFYVVNFELRHRLFGRFVHFMAKLDHLHVINASSETKPSSLIFLCESLLWDTIGWENLTIALWVWPPGSIGNSSTYLHQRCQRHLECCFAFGGVSSPLKMASVKQSRNLPSFLWVRMPLITLSMLWEEFELKENF